MPLSARQIMKLSGETEWVPMQGRCSILPSVAYPSGNLRRVRQRRGDGEMDIETFVGRNDQLVCECVTRYSPASGASGHFLHEAWYVPA